MFRTAVSMRRCILAIFALDLLMVVRGQEAKNDFFSSTTVAPKLVQTHNQLLHIFRQYSEVLNNAAGVFARYLSEDEVSSVSLPWENDGDPLRTYRLVKRTSMDINELVDAIRQLRAFDPLLEIENFRRTEQLPTDTDFQGIGQALVRLQQVYRLNPSDLADGTIREGIQKSAKLTASDCLNLGQLAEEQQTYENAPDMSLEASQWYSAGLQLTTDSPDEDTLRSDLQQNSERVVSQITDEMRANYQISGVSNELLNYSVSWDKVLVTYGRLCRGELMRPPALDVDCLCHLRQGPHPYLKLRPMKLEILSSDPYLVLIHDIIGEKEMAKLKAQALPLMARSIHLAKNSDNVKSDLRVSVTSWIDDTKVPSLNPRIEMMTGLRANETELEAEQYQVLNYGIGGHYTLHYDYFQGMANDELYNKSGDRLATLMMYLSDVEEGGATAFPYLGLAIRPKKGTAAFWWNLMSDCEGDPLTTHGACPVLYGTKWVSNKWFRVFPQMFSAHCGLKAEETMRHL